MDGGRRPTSPEAQRGDSIEREFTGTRGATGGDEPTAWILRRGAGDDESRRRTPAARKGGNGGGATRIQFKEVGASPGFKESISGVGWGGRAPRRAGDERRPPGAGGNGGEAMPGGGGASGSVYACSRG
uniref:Transposon protein, putative, unclassified n=1 Tax=Oryza sativa subsp. japonica TaxID=39947 RepID=Q2QS35_ORYSJ|nr:transposon protein, putative, unclassified [Oryza sativa Japonica Group]